MLCDRYTTSVKNESYLIRARNNIYTDNLITNDGL